MTRTGDERSEKVAASVSFMHAKERERERDEIAALFVYFKAQTSRCFEAHSWYTRFRKVIAAELVPLSFVLEMDWSVVIENTFEEYMGKSLELLTFQIHFF